MLAKTRQGIQKILFQIYEIICTHVISLLLFYSVIYDMVHFNINICQSILIFIAIFEVSCIRSLYGICDEPKYSRCVRNKACGRPMRVRRQTL